jgi:hypothetical protein
MQDMWRGTVHSWMLQGVLHKGKIQLHDAGVDKYVYSNFTMYIEFYYI